VAEVDPRDGVRRVFDRVADTYDRVGVEFFGPIAETLVERVGPQPGDRALDVGCGRGAVLTRLAAAVQPGGSVLGIDISPRMVELTATEVSDLPHVTVQLGDATAPPGEPESYAVIASSLVLFFLPDPLAALEAWRELLTADGRVGVSTFGDYPQAWREVDAIFEPYLPPQLRDARTSGKQGPFASVAGVEGLFADAGYGDVATHVRPFSIDFDGPDAWHRWSMSVGQRAMWEAVPEGERETVRATAYSMLERMAQDTGRIGFEQDVRFTVARR
jgi:ubiquinone/menaquinone biosynthesis C-methylase UbiE